MQLLFQLARKTHMDKVMLTVLKENRRALEFYTEKLGYVLVFLGLTSAQDSTHNVSSFQIDEISPSQCVDDDDNDQEVSYEILSK